MLRRNFAGAALAAVTFLFLPTSPLVGQTIAGRAFTETNAADANAIMIYNRMSDGTLEEAGSVPSGGLGTGAGLGSQGAVALNENGSLLFAVNAGSNNISVFLVRESGLSLVGTYPSGGTMPISVSVRGRLLYVLNAGTPNNITGFYIGAGGALVRIPGSQRALSADATGPAQVGISPDAAFIVVTEKDTNTLDVFGLGPNGFPGQLITTPSNGMTPFGFEFGQNSQVYVSEAFGGAENASAISSYKLEANGSLTVITPSAPTQQSAACWVAVNPGNRVAYTTNTGSSSLSGFGISLNGILTLLTPDGRTGVTPEGSMPIDADFSVDGKYVYALTSGVAGITGFSLGTDGSLTSVSTVAAPATAAGLAVR